MCGGRALAYLSLWNKDIQLWVATPMHMPIKLRDMNEAKRKHNECHLIVNSWIYGSRRTIDVIYIGIGG